LPRKAQKPCLFSGCTALVNSGYCATHAHFYTTPVRTAETYRPSSFRRGYGAKWQEIRNEVLRATGIPKEIWHLYDVHHEPPYNPAIEPDHRKYHLTPMLHRDHSRETARQRGRGGKSLEVGRETDKVKASFHSTKITQGVCDVR